MSATQIHEASVMLAFFTETTDGTAVMDGAGVVWRKFGEAWVSAERRSRRVPAEVLARALCPDLAEHMVVTT